MADSNPLGNIQSAVASALRREVSVYTVPARLTMGGAFVTLGFVQLTMTEELRASARGNQGVEGTIQERLLLESIKESLRQINGQPVSLADGSTDMAFGKMTPQLRQFCAMGYNDCNGTTEADRAGFIASRSDSVGG